MSGNEREIRMADLGAIVLKSARRIVALMLVFALLGALFGVYHEISEAKKETVTAADLNKAEKAVTAAKKKLDTAEKALKKRLDIEIPDAEKKIVRSELLVRRRQEYIDNSIYQAMNPFYHGVSRLTFYVETDVEINPETPWIGTDPQSSIVIGYTRIYSTDTEILDKIREIMNMDVEVQYIKELISVGNVSNRFVEIVVYNDDAEIAEKVVNYLYSVLLERLSANVGDYSANVIGRFTGYEVDWAMSDKQNKNDDDLLSAERALATANESLQTLQDGVADKEKAVEDANTELKKANAELKKLQDAMAGKALNVKEAVKKALIFCAAGLVVGLLFGCFLACVRGIYGGKLQNQHDMLSRYAFPVIGLLPRKKKYFFAKTIRLLEGEAGADYETAAQNTAQSLLAVVGEKKTCLVSTLGEETAATIVPYTGQKLAVCGNVLEDAAAVKRLADFDGVVLVEKREASRLNLIEAEVQRVKALGKEILGVILT